MSYITTNQCNRRIMKEIQEATSEQMRQSGIYYWCNDVNNVEGKAMIIGPEGTPYAHCPLIFDVLFPPSYPDIPHKLHFVTSDGYTRLHPNLYVNGKVCLSILGTWKGPKWSPAMTLSTVLVSVQSVLDENPIVNEPGYEEHTLKNSTAHSYADFVHSRMTSMSIRGLSRWKEGNIPYEWREFRNVLDEIGNKLILKLADIIREKAKNEDIMYDGLVYSMRGKTEWKSLLEVAERLTA
jgi:ubiquitin-conjugating enzyme E2 Z